MTVGQLKRDMDPHEFVEWMAEMHLRAAPADAPLTPDERIEAALAEKASADLDAFAH